MFLSLNRKIIYLISSLLLISSALFILTFYIAYTSKIEKDQQLSILRNQQYTDLLYQHRNLIKEIKNFSDENENFLQKSADYKYLNSIIKESSSSFDFLGNEHQRIIERSQQFDEQYKTINNGIIIIILSTISMTILVVLMGLMITKWILTPINKISNISEQIALGNLNLRIPISPTTTYTDELDRLSETFNMMLDNLQAMMTEIQNKENFLQALIDSIPDGIRVIDGKYRIIAANKAYYKLSGDKSSVGNLCYSSCFQTKTPCSSSHNQCPLHEILVNKKKSLSIIQQFSHKPHSHLSVNAAPLFYDGTHKYIVEAIRDLSEDIDFSHQQKISSLGFLSSSIAHEIKNHLGALRMIIEHMIDKYYINIPENNEQKKMINMIHTEVVNAVDVPERLLKLTRNYETPISDINCTESISEVLSLLDYEIKSKGIDLIYQHPKKVFIIQGNETDFKIVVINIILNALKAMVGKGTLTIKISYSQTEGIKISFTDTGVGIAKENLDNIFNPFFSEGHQGSNTKGSGLGLAISKSIVEKSGGTISVSSVLGKGSCFTLTFPYQQKNLKKNKQRVIKAKKIR